ncbi:MAG: hypothetical protein ACI4MH_01175 [Candidatus Coproplasma sp.]
MIKLKKLICIFIAAVASIGACIAFAACNGEEETKKTKYDVAIRVGCSDGNLYEFPVGIDELHIEIPYDGIERRYSVKAYNLPDHPRWSKEWFSPSGEGANVFGKTITYCAPGGLNQSYSGPVKEIGEYCISIYADSTSNLWYFRSIYLFIKVI